MSVSKQSMRMFVVVGLAVGLVACPRVVVTEQAKAMCTPELCGREVAVSTNLAPKTTLTAAECDTICATVWCGAKPISRNSTTNPEGCVLLSGSSVLCTAIAYDCGYSFGCGGPTACSGQCRGALGCCEAYAPQCTGSESSCADCPAADARCSPSACASFRACGGALETEPAASACADADGGVDATIDLVSFCPDACNAAHAGEIIEQCPPDAGVDAGSGSCVDSCRSARTVCEAACTRASFGACISCAASCGVKFGQCRRACP